MGIASALNSSDGKLTYKNQSNLLVTIPLLQDARSVSVTVQNDEQLYKFSHTIASPWEYETVLDEVVTVAYLDSSDYEVPEDFRDALRVALEGLIEFRFRSESLTSLIPLYRVGRLD